MLRILVPMDGSAPALRALDHAVERLARCGGGEIHLLNIQPPIPASVGDFVGADVVGRYQQEEGETALAAARRRLQEAGARHVVATRVGIVADTVADYIAETGCEEIVMGSRGLGALSGMLLGSVATRILHAATVPVTIVK